MDVFPGHALQDVIAFQTAGQKPGRIHFVTQEVQDLANLINQAIAADEKMSRQPPTLNQTRVTSQGDTLFIQAALYDLLIVDSVVIGDIITENAQPFGQAAQHHVSQ